MATAPVCAVQPQVDIGTAQQPRLPSIPTPDGSVDGMMAALMALKDGYEMLAGMRNNAPPNNSKSSQSSSSPGANGKKPTKQGRFTEVNRVTKKVRITNPDDEEQFVDVLRIDNLTFKDTVTGELWTWTRGN